MSPESTSSGDEKLPLLSRAKQLLNTVAASIVVVAGVVGSIFGVITFIEHRVEVIVTSEEFIKNLSDRIRPVLIFDAQGVVIADQGGMRFLERPPDVRLMEGGTEWFGPYEIRIFPKHHLSTPPLLEKLSGGVTVLEPKRGKNFELIYVIEVSFRAGGDEGPMVFRLEFLE